VAIGNSGEATKAKATVRDTRSNPLCWGALRRDSFDPVHAARFGIPASPEVAARSTLLAARHISSTSRSESVG